MPEDSGAKTPVKKVVVPGVQNAGKTSIIKSIIDGTTDNALNLKPSKNIKTKVFSSETSRFAIWDLAGTYRYRVHFLTNPLFVFSYVEELIYVINVQDEENYVDSFEYLSKILTILKKLQFEKKILIFLHWSDHVGLSSNGFDIKLECVYNELEKYIPTHKCKIYKTS